MSDASDEEPAASAAPALKVLHEDDDFVAVSKPSGLLVHRDEHHPDAPAALQSTCPSSSGTDLKTECKSAFGE